MKKFMKLLVLMLVILGVEVYAGEKDILGVWLTPGGDHVKIYKEKGKYVGEIIKLAEPVYPDDHEMAGQEKIDTENPDSAKNGQSIVGMRFLSGFKYKKGQFKSGKVYDPGNGKTYYGKMKLDGEVLKLRGSIDKMGLAGRTQEWKKIN